MYTEADLLFYYFVQPKRLYILPMCKTRNWFIKRINQFQESETTTPIGGGDYYTTVGRLVPITKILDEISCIYIYNSKNFLSN